MESQEKQMETFLDPVDPYTDTENSPTNQNVPFYTVHQSQISIAATILIFLGGDETRLNNIPVDNIPDGLDVIGTNVTV